MERAIRRGGAWYEADFSVYNNNFFCFGGNVVSLWFQNSNFEILGALNAEFISLPNELGFLLVWVNLSLWFRQDQTALVASQFLYIGDGSSFFFHLRQIPAFERERKARGRRRKERKIFDVHSTKVIFFFIFVASFCFLFFYLFK